MTKDDPFGNSIDSSKGWRYWVSFGRFVEIMNSLGTGWIFVLLLLINSDIIGRTILNRPVTGVTEIVGMTIVACVFLQLPHALKINRLTSSDIIVSKFAHKVFIKASLEIAYNLCGAAILVILFIYSIPLFTHAWSIGEFVGAEGSFTAPIWPVKLIILIGCLIAALQCLLNCYQIVKKVRMNGFSATGKNP